MDNGLSIGIDTNELKEKLLGGGIPQSVLERSLLIMGVKAPPKPLRERMLILLRIKVRRSKYTEQVAELVSKEIIKRGSFVS